MSSPDHYRGREQADIKHRLLEAYLERLFMIVGHHERTITYVDCFAGPWEEQGDDLADTSIARSLNIIKKCREGLREIRRNAPGFRALFVEQNNKSFQKLEAYLASRKVDGIDTHALKGSFHELIPEILNWCSHRDFVFFFIDPKGWKNDIEQSTLPPLLKRPNSEFLINFMYGFLSRFVSMVKLRDDMRRVFGILPDVQGMSPEQREACLLLRYRNNLKQVRPMGGGQPRTASVKVLNPTKDRTLYHLVYLTRHPKGIVEFMAASEKPDLVQRRARAKAKQDARVQRSGQLELYSDDKQIKENQIELDLSGMEEYWLQRLTTDPERHGIAELADMLEETGWFESELQMAFGALAKKGKVKNLDGSPRRLKNFIYFDANHNKGERLVKVSL